MLFVHVSKTSLFFNLLFNTDQTARRLASKPLIYDNHCPNNIFRYTTGSVQS